MVSKLCENGSQLQCSQMVRNYGAVNLTTCGPIRCNFNDRTVRNTGSIHTAVYGPHTDRLLRPEIVLDPANNPIGIAFAKFIDLTEKEKCLNLYKENKFIFIR